MRWRARGALAGLVFSTLLVLVIIAAKPGFNPELFPDALILVGETAWMPGLF